jgi:hypothetical protein
MSTVSSWLHLPDQASDTEVLSQVKRTLREAEQSAALVIAGSFAGEVKDVKAHSDTIGLLLDAPIPVFAVSSGPIGPRGLALLLATDRIVIGPAANTTSDWRRTPGLGPLLHHRLGAAPARAIVLDPSIDIIARLVEHGLAARSSNPDAYVQESTAALGNGLGPRLKRALKAASELPLREALSFDLWLARSQQGGAP